MSFLPKPKGRGWPQSSPPSSYFFTRHPPSVVVLANPPLRWFLQIALILEQGSTRFDPPAAHQESQTTSLPWSPDSSPCACCPGPWVVLGIPLLRWFSQIRLAVRCCLHLTFRHLVSSWYTCLVSQISEGDVPPQGCTAHVVTTSDFLKRGGSGWGGGIGALARASVQAGRGHCLVEISCAWVSTLDLALTAC